MKPIIPISIKREAVARMQQVQAGRLSREEGAAMLKRRVGKERISRDEIITLLTRSYDSEAAAAFQFFRLL